MLGELVVVDDVAAEFTERVVEAFHRRPHDLFSLALTGGEPAGACYQRLADDAGGGIDWWAVDVYWANEVCGPDDATNYQLGRHALLDRVGVANALFPLRCADGPDPYQLRLAELGSLDVVHLTLDPDGSVAGLFAGAPAPQPGRLVVATTDPATGTGHLTITPQALDRAAQVLVTVGGTAAAGALAAVHAGDVAVVATAVDRPGVVWIADPDAADGLA